MKAKKNHECEFCERPFPTSGSLKLHIKQFLMVERIKIVTVVVNHFFLRDISYSNFSNFQWLRHSFSYPYANVWMILLLSSPLHITLEEPLICDVAGAQNRVLWVLKITWLYGIFFSIWICICSKSNCTFLHFVLWKFIK